MKSVRLAVTLVGVWFVVGLAALAFPPALGAIDDEDSENEPIVDPEDELAPEILELFDEWQEKKRKITVHSNPPRE